MRRTLVRLAVFLLIGGVINVAVAWTCALTVNISAAPKVTGTSAAWQVISQRSWGAQRIESFRRRGLGTSPNTALALAGRWSPVSQPTPQWLSMEAKVEERTIDCRGLPLLSMYYEHSRRLRSTERGERKWPRRWGFKPKLSPFVDSATGTVSPRILPLRPIPVGFAINTLIYGGGLWLMIATRRWLCERRRHDASCCQSCGYPIRVEGSETCSECGAAVVRTASKEVTVVTTVRYDLSASWHCRSLVLSAF